MNKKDNKRKTVKSSNLVDSKNIITEISQLILKARSLAVRSIDTIQVFTNFQIGKRIVEHEQKGKRRAEYGNLLLTLL